MEVENNAFEYAEHRSLWKSWSTATVQQHRRQMGSQASGRTRNPLTRAHERAVVRAGTENGD